MEAIDQYSPSPEHARSPLAGGLLALLLVVSPLFGSPLAAQSRLDPSKVEWRKLSFVASKLLLTVESEVELEPRSRKRAVAELIVPEEGRGLTPGRRGAVLISTRTDFLGRLSVDRLWVDGRTGAALQRTVVETGSRNRYKTLRFTDRGVEIERRYPTDAHERESVDPAQWSDRSVEHVSWPDNLPDGAPVIEAATFFYFAAVALLHRPDDSLTTYLWAGDRVNELVLRAEAVEPLEVSYRRTGESGSEPVEATVEAVRVTARARALTGEETVVELLGLENVVLHLDPERGLPLEVRGEVSIVGTVRAVLQAVELR